MFLQSNPSPTIDPNALRAIEQFSTVLNEVEQRLQLVRATLTQTFPQQVSASSLGGAPVVGGTPGVFGPPPFMGPFAGLTPSGATGPSQTIPPFLPPELLQNPLALQQFLFTLGASLGAQPVLGGGSFGASGGVPPHTPGFGVPPGVFGTPGVGVHSGIAPGFQAPFAHFRRG